MVGQRCLSERHEQLRVIPGHEFDHCASCTCIYCRGSLFHVQLYVSDNYWSSLNKLHSSIWTLTRFFLVCLVKLLHNWPSRVGSSKQTLPAESVFSSAFTLRQSLCFLEEQGDSPQCLSTARTDPPPVKHSWKKAAKSPMACGLFFFFIECVINLQSMLIHFSIRLRHTFVIYKSALNRLAYDLIYVTVNPK